MGRLVEENSLRANDTGFEFEVRLNWYRSLPLSCMDQLQVALDGHPVDPDLIRFGINEHEYSLVELAELVEEYWFVQDAARLVVLQPGKVNPGEIHTIDAEIIMRAPYIPIGPQRYLTIGTQYSLTQKAS